MYECHNAFKLDECQSWTEKTVCLFYKKEVPVTMLKEFPGEITDNLDFQGAKKRYFIKKL